MAANHSHDFSAIKMLEKNSSNAKMPPMKNKPLIFSLLSLLCLLEPFIQYYFTKNPGSWLVYPVAGLFLLKLRVWSYFGFLSVLGYSVATTGPNALMYQYVMALLSVMTITYFLTSKMRQPFFDRRVRWWEPHVRHEVQIPCVLKTQYLAYPCLILNISKSGAFLQDSNSLKVGERLTMEINFLGHALEVPVVIIHRHTVKGVTGYGLKFRLGMYQTWKLRRIIRVIERSKICLKDATVY